MRLVRWILTDEAEYVGERLVLWTCLLAFVLVVTGAIR